MRIRILISSDALGISLSVMKVLLLYVDFHALMNMLFGREENV